jgi:lambda family phage tail tape measure protein
MATIRDRYVLDIDTRGAANALNGLKGALIAIGGAVVTKQILDITATFEDLRTSLNTVTGSAAAGGRALEQIRSFATQSQFGVEELARTFIQLRAAGIEPTERLLRTFTDTAAVTTDQIGSLEAITALLARTTGGGLGLEELERLADRGIPVYRILQEQIGLTRQEISEFGQTAEGARQIVNALLTGLDQEFGGATLARLQNLSTVMSNFQIAIKDVANEFGTGLSPAIKTITTDITNFLNENGNFARTVGQVLGDALLKIRDLIKSIVEQLGLLNAGGLQEFTANLTDGLANFVEGFAASIDAFVNTFGEMQNAINNLISAMSRIPGIGFDIVTKPADQSIDEFIDRTRSRIEQLRSEIGNAGLLDDVAATAAIISPLASAADRAAAAQFLNAKTELANLEAQLEQMTSGDGTIIYLDELATNSIRVSEATAPMVQSLRDSAAAMRETAEAARFNEQYPVYEDAILRYARAQQAATEANGEFITTMNEITETPFNTFYNQLIEQSRASVTELEYAQMALEGLNEALRAGVITPQVYAEAMERLNNILDITDDSAERAATALRNASESTTSYLESINQSTEDAQFNLESLNMTPLQRQIAEIERDLSRGLNRQIADLNRQLAEGADPSQIQQQIQTITNATQQAIQQQSEFARQAQETQTSFAYGWQQAFEEYADNANNASRRAGELFESVTSGMEDSIVNFAKTGKFEFKDFIADIAEQILRSNIQRLIAQTFGAFGGGGGGSLPFAGFFANGGTIPAGQFGVVGERGPELVTGPATVTPMSMGSGTVNYYINAVDAPSFRSLVARDPGFIHAVSQQGAKTVPGRRR